ncbi:MAG: PKD domain-containing protein [Bacteroidetes bacterium]|nr:PKD domain-containing protein [Bacteroidota bacterium]
MTAPQFNTLVEEGNKYYLIATRGANDLYKVSLGVDLANTSDDAVQTISTSVVTPQRFAISSAININNGLRLYTASEGSVNNHLVRISFSANCGSSSQANQAAPSQVSLTGTGPRLIQYQACNDGFRCRDTVISVTALQAPTASFSTTPSCLGETNAFTSTITTDPLDAPLSYAWNFGNGATSSIQNPTYTYPGAGNYTVTLDVATNRGCSDNYTQTLAVRPKPVASFTHTNPCPGDSISFTGTSTLSEGTIVTREWVMGNGQTLVNPPLNVQGAFKYKYLLPGSYDIKLRVTTDNGCRDSITKTLVYPGADFAVGQSCVGQPTSLTATYTAPGGAALSGLKWAVDGTEILGNPASYTFGFEGTYEVSLILTYDNGCRDTVTKNVTVGQIPTANFTVAQPCVNLNTSFTDTSTLGGNQSIVSWAWNFGDLASGSANTSNLRNPTHNYATAGTYTVSLTITSSTGCQAATSRAITISTPKTLSIQAPALACQSQPVQLSTTQTFQTYNWTVETGSGTLFSTLAAPSFIFATTGVRTISVTAVDENGCSLSSSQVVSVQAVPQALFSVTGANLNGQYYTDSTLTFTSQSTQGAGLSWEIQPLGEQRTAATFSYAFQDPGTYTIQLIALNPNGCADTTRQSLVVIPAPDPIADLSIVGMQATVEGTVVRTRLQLTNTGNQVIENFRLGSFPADNLPAFQDFSVRLVPGASLDTSLSQLWFFSPTNPYEFICAEVARINGATDLVTENNRKCEFFGSDLSVHRVYPIPATRELWVELASSSTRLLEIELIDQMGRTSYRTSSRPLGAGFQRIRIPLSGIQDGLYTLRVQQGKADYKQRILVAN